MRSTEMRLIRNLFRDQHGVASRRQLRQFGVTAAQERHRVAAGDWERPTPTVLRLAGSPLTPMQDLAVVWLEAGPAAVVSHQSAAWLWDLEQVPEVHSVTVPLGTWGGQPESRGRVHRLGGPPPQPSFRRGFPVTNPLRTLVDLAGVVATDRLDTAVDRAVAGKLVSVEGLWEEVARLTRRGRKGTGAMRRSLDRRGLGEGPHPSVLEACFHRLLRSVGLAPLAVEVVSGPHGEYRLDVVLDPTVAVEVDGHAHHSSPEQKRYDEQRRARLRLEGVFILVYDWREVVHDGRRVAAEIRLALARHGSGSHRLPHRSAVTQSAPRSA